MKSTWATKTCLFQHLHGHRDQLADGLVGMVLYDLGDDGGVIRAPVCARHLVALAGHVVTDLFCNLHRVLGISD